jgi:hypothetical protein
LWPEAVAAVMAETELIQLHNLVVVVALAVCYMAHKY